jgi:hypothetical protein
MKDIKIKKGIKANNLYEDQQDVVELLNLKLTEEKNDTGPKEIPINVPSHVC